MRKLQDTAMWSTNLTTCSIRNETLVLACVSASSALVLILHNISLFASMTKLHAPASRSQSINESPTSVPNDTTRPPTQIDRLDSGVFDDSGSAIYRYKVGRLLGCLSLIALSISTNVLPGKHIPYGGYEEQIAFADTRWEQPALSAAIVSALITSLAMLIAYAGLFYIACSSFSIFSLSVEPSFLQASRCDSSVHLRDIRLSRPLAACDLHAKPC